MPTYMYRCINENCKEEYEISHSIKDDPTLYCQKCASDLKKIPSNIFVKNINPIQVSNQNTLQKSIEESKKDLKDEKDLLKNRVWKI